MTADGAANSHRSRLWKVSPQELADEWELKPVTCHFPPGTNKWNYWPVSHNPLRKTNLTQFPLLQRERLLHTKIEFR